MKKFIVGLTLSLLCWFPINAEAYQSSVEKAYSDNIRQGDGKIVTSITDHNLDVPEGVVDDEKSVNVSGLAPAGVQTTISDIWDLANATPTSQLWVAPTEARVHQLVSSSTSDDGDPAGVGARTVRVWYLATWDTQETTIDVTMDGTTNVALPSCVMINKIMVLTKGATNSNVGIIKATADTDTTITANMIAGEGQTHMAVYGISSLDTAYITQFDGSIRKAVGTWIDYSLAVNSEPGDEELNFVTLKTRGVQVAGRSNDRWPYVPYLKVEGPALIKIQGIASTADTDGSAGFDVIKKTDTSGFNVLITSHSRSELDRRILTTKNGRVLITTQ